jgi:hypothetical protein
MEQLDLKITDTVQHIKRGSRYVITGSRRYCVNDFTDGQIMCLLSDRTKSEQAIGLKDVLSFSTDWNKLNEMQIVMLQIDPQSKELGQKTSNGNIYLDFLIYEALDAPKSAHEPRKFMRPCVEFTADRFRLIDGRSQIALAVRMLPQDIRLKLIESWQEYSPHIGEKMDPAEFYATVFQDCDILRTCRMISKDPAPEEVIQTYFDLVKSLRLELR